MLWFNLYVILSLICGCLCLNVVSVCVVWFVVKLLGMLSWIVSVIVVFDSVFSILLFSVSMCCV